MKLILSITALSTILLIALYLFGTELRLCSKTIGCISSNMYFLYKADCEEAAKKWSKSTNYWYECK